MKTSLRALLSLGSGVGIGACVASTTFTTTALQIGTFEIAAPAMDLIVKLVVIAIPMYLIWYFTAPKRTRRFKRSRRY